MSMHMIVYITYMYGIEYIGVYVHVRRSYMYDWYRYTYMYGTCFKSTII